MGKKINEVAKNLVSLKLGLLCPTASDTVFGGFPPSPGGSPAECIKPWTCQGSPTYPNHHSDFCGLKECGWGTWASPEGWTMECGVEWGGLHPGSQHEGVRISCGAVNPTASGAVTVE